MKVKGLIITLVVALIGISGFLGYKLLFKEEFKVKTFDKKVELNYGEEFTDKSGDICYGNKIKCNKVEVKSSGDVDTNKVGEYKKIYTYTYKGKTYEVEQTIEVVDKEEPVIEVADTNIDVCPNGKYGKFKYTAKDNVDGDLTSKVTIKYEDNKLILTVTDSSNNTATKEIEVDAKDTKAPTIKLKGDKAVYIAVGDTYKDQGATVKDNCDDKVELKTTGTVNTSKTGTYKITYTATDSANNTATVQRLVYVEKVVPRQKPSNIKKGARIIYLTFDDGPGQYTNKLLDILKKYDVKVTFFVTGSGSDSIIKREFNEGHTVALHTYTHNYNIYTNINTYFKDLNKIQNRIKKITGQETRLIRFPGGSSNTVSRRYDGGTHIMSKLTKEVEKRGYYYFDWNCSSGDAAGTPISSTAVYNNVIRGLKEDYTVVLQHDIKGFSVDAVERIIQYGLKNGYTFERLTETSPGAHHGVNN